MADAVAGLSTLGVTFSYGVETTAGTKPTSFKLLTRINSIDEITVTPEAIDASALEDKQTRNIAGRDTVTDTVAVTVNKTDATIKEWKDVITAYNELTGGKRMSSLWHSHHQSYQLQVKSRTDSLQWLSTLLLRI